VQGHVCAQERASLRDRVRVCDECVRGHDLRRVCVMKRPMMSVRDDTLTLPRVCVMTRSTMNVSDDTGHHTECVR
jgi:hypothetical protein